MRTVLQERSLAQGALTFEKRVAEEMPAPMTLPAPERPAPAALPAPTALFLPSAALETKVEATEGPAPGQRAQT